MNTVCRKQKGRRVLKCMLPHFIRWQKNVDPHSENNTNTHLFYNALIDKHHAGPTELLHIWFHLNTTWDDSIWQVVIHERDLCKKTVRRTKAVINSVSEAQKHSQCLQRHAYYVKRLLSGELGKNGYIRPQQRLHRQIENLAILSAKSIF